MLIPVRNRCSSHHSAFKDFAAQSMRGSQVTVGGGAVASDSDSLSWMAMVKVGFKPPKTPEMFPL